MTGTDDARRAATERAVRGAMADAAQDLPEVPDLVAGMHRRATRIRRRRAVVTAVAAGVAVVAVVGVAGRTLQHGDGGAPIAPAARTPAARTATTPSGTPSTPATPSAPSTPSTPATSAGTPAVTGSPPATVPGTATSTLPSGSGRTPPPASTSAQPGAAWGTPNLDERFGSPALDPGRWVLYQGTSASPETVWSAAEVRPGGGALRLAVDRVAAVTPVARAGGVKLAGAGQRYGRWEVRWRMTSGYGVVGQVLLLGEGPGGIGHIATLSSARHLLTIEDLVHGTRQDVSLDGTAYHTLAVEAVPGRVRWLLDGRRVAEGTGAPGRPVVLGLQALVQDTDCGRRPLPAACPGPASFPQYLDVDAVRVWNYRA